PPERINAYGYMLESLGAGLWAVRLFLLVCLVAQVWVGIQLTLENRAARPDAYKARHTIRATLASRVMGRTGFVVLLFLIYHLLHFTFRVQNPAWSEHSYQLADGTAVRNLHAMMLQGFSQPVV